MPSSYPSNLTHDQWKLLESLIPAAKPGGRPRSVNMQAVVNAILYILCAGCAWRMLPSDFPGWKTVYHYFRVWRMDGTWEQINHKLHQWVRVSEDRHPCPSAAILDSQSVKTATPGAIDVGYDGAKQTKGRKRHLLVDTLGLVRHGGCDSRQCTRPCRRKINFCAYARGTKLGASPSYDLGGWGLPGAELYAICDGHLSLGD